jgi:5'-nucleotidase
VSKKNRSFLSLLLAARLTSLKLISERGWTWQKQFVKDDMGRTTPLILVTNDDGINSPGLHAAVEAVADLGEPLIVAPLTQQTSMGRSMPVGNEIGVVGERLLTIAGRRYPAYAVNGSPAQAVLHAILELAPRVPLLCVSGVNYGENLGASITRSGTVGAALEAAAQRVPAIAISLEAPLEVHHADGYAEIDWTAALHFTRLLAKRVLQQGLPEGARLLNVAMPATATLATALRVTRQSHQNYYNERMPQPRDITTAYRFFASTGFDLVTLEADSDIYAFAVDRVVSVTPLTLDLTARQLSSSWLTAPERD